MQAEWGETGTAGKERGGRGGVELSNEFTGHRAALRSVL